METNCSYGETKSPAVGARWQPPEFVVRERRMGRAEDVDKRRRRYLCSHDVPRTLCLECAGLTEHGAEEWNKNRTTERRIRPLYHKLGKYTGVKISGADRSLISRRAGSVEMGKISEWYECRNCNIVKEVAKGTKVTLCLRCNGTLAPTAEPFQSFQFSPEIGSGAETHNYAAAGPSDKCVSKEAGIISDLFCDCNNRFQPGGSGYLRTPLDAARKARRAEAPEWLDRRADFIRNLRPTRSARAEQILSAFYLEEKTDTQISPLVGWAKDSVKKERASLIREGNNFFRSLAADNPPRPAIDEKVRPAIPRAEDRTPDVDSRHSKTCCLAFQV